MTAQEKTAIVTASCSGIGHELSRQLVERGYRLGVVNRNTARAARMIKEITQDHPGAVIQSYAADLSDHADIHRVASEIATDFPRINALFNNAGVLLPDLRYSPQGNEMHFEINTVAPFLLLHLLKPQLAGAEGGVVVTSGSGARRMARSLSVDQLRSPTSFSKMSGPYAQSKLAISAACAALADDFKASGIQLRVVDMNPTKTAMSRSDGMPGWVKWLRFMFNSPQKSAGQLLQAALAPQEKQPDHMPDKATQQQLLVLLYEVTGLTPGAGIQAA